MRGKKLLSVTGSGNTLFKSATYSEKTPLFKVMNEVKANRIHDEKVERFANKNRNFMGDWL